MSAAGLPVDDALFVPGGFDFTSGIAAGEALLALPQPPTAIFATNDDMALGIYDPGPPHGPERAGRSVSRRFRRYPRESRRWPPLTTVRQPLEEMGRSVIDALANGPLDEPEFLFTLVERGSCGPRPG